MARVVIIPESTDNVTDVALLIRVVRATGAAVIMSHCLHYRTKNQEDGTVIVCDDCGAISPGPNAGAVPDLEPSDCPHGADGRVCETGCSCDCHATASPDVVVPKKIADACSDHPKGCPPNSHLPGLCKHPNKEGSEDGTILVCSDCGRDLSPPVNKTGNGDQPESEDLGTQPIPLG